MNQEIEVSFNEGEDAGFRGTLEGMNPYQIGDDDYHEWSNGWAKGNDKRIKESEIKFVNRKGEIVDILPSTNVKFNGTIIAQSGGGKIFASTSIEDFKNLS
jgi:ribosome modulation factor